MQGAYLWVMVGSVLLVCPSPPPAAGRLGQQDSCMIVALLEAVSALRVHGAGASGGARLGGWVERDPGQGLLASGGNSPHWLMASGGNYTSLQACYWAVGLLLGSE